VRARALALALLLALVLGACGEGAASTSSSGQTTNATNAHPRIAPFKVSGGGSAQFHVKGGDNSIQDYGAESARAELVRAARAARGYFAALAGEEWAGACGWLTRKERRAVQTLASSSPRFRGKGCASALGVLFGKVSIAEGYEATVLDAIALRQKGSQGFLIYRGAGRKPYFVSLQSEGGHWLVSGLGPTPLP
jgi:hypothetical protein